LFGRCNSGRRGGHHDGKRKAGGKLHGVTVARTAARFLRFLPPVRKTSRAQPGSLTQIDQRRRNAPRNLRSVTGGAPSCHSEACRKHQSRHQQKHARKLAHLVPCNQPRTSENEHALPSRKMQLG
jgi:hypothetical protein